MKKIQLTKFRYALVDDDDYERLNKHWWHVNSGGYAVRNTKQGVVHMHREVCGTPPPGSVVDHIDGDRLDNRKENLRIATYQENAVNKHNRVKAVSGHRNVHWDSSRKLFKVIFYRHGVKRYYGSGRTVEEALVIADKVRAELNDT